MNELLTNPWLVAGTVLGITSTLSGIAHVVIKALAARAATKASKDDEAKYARWLDRVDTIMFVADVIRRMPRFTVGPFPSTQPIASVATSLPPMKPLSAPPPAPATPESKDAK